MPYTHFVEVFTYPLLLLFAERFEFLEKHTWYLSNPLDTLSLYFLSFYLFYFIVLNCMYYFFRNKTFVLIPKVSEKPFLSLVILYISFSALLIVMSAIDTEQDAKSTLANAFADEGRFREVFELSPSFIPKNSNQTKQLESFNEKTFQMYNSLAIAYERGLNDLAIDTTKVQRFKNKLHLMQLELAKNGDVVSLIEASNHADLSEEKIKHIISTIPKTCENAARVYGVIGLKTRNNYSMDHLFTPWADSFSKEGCIPEYNERMQKEMNYAHNQ